MTKTLSISLARHRLVLVTTQLSRINRLQIETGSISRLMKVYRVEEIENNTVRTTQVIEAFTPFQAAVKVIGREVRLRKDEPSWIQVTEVLTRAKQTRDGRVFEYSVGSYPSHG
ncbi:hypothetical protein NKH47_00655 [Mesorhizobium sp. M1060]|uniref:hypothetical protein n=1 Tax=unclassified Mesorhizobium TaxID=325217 RepID=UPI0012ECA21E|nr:hypothetical protein [Mesorhizobium sp. LNJC386A00]